MPPIPPPASGAERWSITVVVEDGGALVAHFQPRHSEILEVTMRLVPVGGDLTLRALSACRWRGAVDQVLTATDLRSLPIESMIAMAREAVRESQPAEVWAVDPQALEAVRARFDASAEPQAHRRRLPDEVFVRVALLYLQLVADGVTTGIQAKIAEAETVLQGRPVSVNGARDLIRGARERGFLGASTRARARLSPGPALAAAIGPDDATSIGLPTVDDIVNAEADLADATRDALRRRASVPSIDDINAGETDFGRAITEKTPQPAEEDR